MFHQIWSQPPQAIFTLQHGLFKFYASAEVEQTQQTVKKKNGTKASVFKDPWGTERRRKRSPLRRKQRRRRDTMRRAESEFFCNLTRRVLWFCQKSFVKVMRRFGRLSFAERHDLSTNCWGLKFWATENLLLHSFGVDCGASYLTSKSVVSEDLKHINYS